MIFQKAFTWTEFKKVLRASSWSGVKMWKRVGASGKSGLRPTENTQAPSTFKGLAEEQELSQECEKK